MKSTILLKSRVKAYFKDRDKIEILANLHGTDLGD